MAFENSDVKDIILATLAEIEGDLDSEQAPYEQTRSFEEDLRESMQASAPQQEPANRASDEPADQPNEQEIIADLNKNTDNETAFLTSMRARLLVLFEGLQMPHNSTNEKKLELTLNYLQYTLATIDERLGKK